MAAAIRARDWSTSSLGPLRSWPQSLRAALGIMLHARYPISVYWGPELVNFYNDAYLPILANKHPAALGRPLREVWPEVWDSIGPALRGVLREGRTFFAENQQQFVVRGGLREEIFMTFSYSPIVTAEGEVQGVLAAGTEVTSTVIGQRRLKLLRELGSEPAAAPTPRAACRAMASVLERYREDVPFAVFFLRDAKGAWRPVAAAGFDTELDALPTLPADIPEGVVTAEETGVSFPSGPWEEVPERAGVWQLRSEPAAAPLALLLCGFSSRRPLDESCRGFHTLLIEQCGRALAAAFALALAESRRQELEELDRTKTEFLATVSHEIRTPLSNIVMAARLADQTGERRYLDTIRANAERLGDLLDGVLTLARLEAGAELERPEPMLLAELTAEIVEAWRGRAEAKGLVVELDITPPGAGASVAIDSSAFTSILQNLLSNAIKFTEKGEILVRLDAGSTHSELFVLDTGVGISEAFLPSLFRPFAQENQGWGRSHEGSGIGLALTHRLVRACGGHITVVSHKGAGADFVVRLPLARSPSREVSRPVLGQRGSQARPRLLLAEDQEDTRAMLSVLLDKVGEVTAVADGEEALSVARTQPFDALLFDVHLGGRLTGPEVLRRLRATAALARTPAIAITAYALPGDREKLLDSGFDAYLPKPVDIDELLRLVRELTGREPVDAA
jgi:signal transduction histidine kinase/CheY-like chemotaxis protein